MPPCRHAALFAGGRSLLRAAFSPLTTYGAADPRRSKMQTLVELPPTDSSVIGFTQIRGNIRLVTQTRLSKPGA